MTRDPVCGMEIDPQTAVDTREYEGQTYYFCSSSCVEQFDADLPSWATWISQNNNGSWYLFSLKPRPYLLQWVRTSDLCACSGIVLGKPNPDWRESLIKVADIK